MNKAQFRIPRFPGHCASCDAKLIDTCPACQTHNRDLGYRRITFALSNDTEGFVSFCPSCAEQEWTPKRLQALSVQCQEGWVRNGWAEGAEIQFLRPTGRVQSWAEVQ